MVVMMSGGQSLVYKASSLLQTETIRNKSDNIRPLNQNLPDLPGLFGTTILLFISAIPSSTLSANIIFIVIMQVSL